MTFDSLGRISPYIHLHQPELIIRRKGHFCPQCGITTTALIDGQCVWCYTK